MINFLQNRPGWLRALQIFLIVAVSVTLLGWLVVTPPGLLGKADAVGYAVCHRIDVRSFHIGDRQVPLCARCSGMYLGGLLGMVYLAGFGRKSGMPPLKVAWVFILFLVAFAVDGSNSYLHFFPGAPSLYQPENWLRLITGTGIGLGIAVVLMPVVHQTFWQTIDPRPALAGWRQVLPLLGLAGVVDLMVWSENPLLLFPLAVLSAGSVLMILTVVYSIVWTLIAKQDNRFHSWRQLWMAALAGFLTALLQIAVIDAGRFWLTGTWGGFNL